MLPGLPPLPKSLSGFSFGDQPPTPARNSSIRSPPVGQSNGKLDAKLNVLRKEMYQLRQQDLALLAQLWALNEALQEYRQKAFEPLSPTASSVDEEDEEFYT